MGQTTANVSKDDRIGEDNIMNTIPAAIAAALLTALPLTALAQQQGNWLTYEDPLFGMKVDYPANWERADSQYGVDFVPPNVPPMTSFSIKNTPAGYLGPSAPRESLKETIDAMRGSAFKNTRVLEVNSTMLGTLPAAKALVTFDVESDLFVPEVGMVEAGTYKSVLIATVTDNGEYTVNYMTPGWGSTWNELAPTFEKMVQSVEIMSEEGAGAEGQF
jgi:hypothetical protein